MENIKLKVLTQAQYQFLETKETGGYYDNRTREQLYSLIEKLGTHKKDCSREESRLQRKFNGTEFGILLPGNRKTTGPLKFRASLCINGDHEGDVSTSGTLIIGDQGSVQGNISAQEVICKGKMTGDVSALQKLILYSTGTLLGDLVTPAVQIAPGALFKGKCKLGSPQRQTEERKPERIPIKRRLIQLFKTG